MRVFIDESMEWIDLKAFAEWWIDWLLEPTYYDYGATPCPNNP